MISSQPSCNFDILFGPTIPENRRLLQDVQFTYKGRGAILKILNSIDKDQMGDLVLAPALHCPTVIQPILMAGFRVKYFEINQDLSINLADLLLQLDEQVAAVITINYFGFPQDISAVKSRCELKNSLLIEDCSHSFIYDAPLQLAGESGHCAVYSFWKLLPSYAGGGIRINAPDRIRLRPSHITLSTKSKLRMLKHILEQSVEHMPGGVFKAALQGAESLRLRLNSKLIGGREDTPLEDNQNTTPDGGFYPLIGELFADQMPTLATRIINKSDLNKLIRLRRQNYDLLLRAFPNHQKPLILYPKLPARVCPWGFPILVPNRSLYDYKLRDAGVNFFTFAESLHNSLNHETCNSSGLENAHALSESLLCLSIHQDIGGNRLLENAQITREVIG